MTIPTPSVEGECLITGEEFISHTRPVVYVWKRGDEYLYIGMSAIGIGRLFRRHNHINPESVRKEDTISWTFFESRLLAARKELELIREHKPILNKVHKYI